MKVSNLKREPNLMVNTAQFLGSSKCLAYTYIPMESPRHLELLI